MVVSTKKTNLLFIYLMLYIPLLFSQVPNDDCTNAIDYGILDGDLSTYDWIGVGNHDTCFTLTNQDAIPNFPFYYTSNYCGEQSSVQIDDVFNDVWFKVEAYGSIRMLVYPNLYSENDTMKITFWHDAGNGCGDFHIGGMSSIIPLDNWNSFYDTFSIPFSGTWYAQVSSINPLDTVDVVICLSDVGIPSGLYCTMTESPYDSLCFMTSVDFTNPTESNNNGSVFIDVSYGTAPYSFLWEDGSTSNALENLSSGDYYVTISDATGCSETLDVSLETSTSIHSISEEKIKIFPNPAKHSIRVDLPIHTMKLFKVANYFYMTKKEKVL